MAQRWYIVKTSISRFFAALRITSITILVLFTFLMLSIVGDAVGISSRQDKPPQQSAPLPKDVLKLEEASFKIVYESLRQTEGGENWELFIVKADGSEPVNLTKTPELDEMYPHVSPDGKKICFVADEGEGREKRRHVYYMNIDGTGRIKLADNARQSCWSPDSKTIAYLKAEYESYTIKDFATKYLFFYDLETGKHAEHVNKDLFHLYNICWSPDGKWFLATVHGGMGFGHAILAFKTDGKEVYDLTKFGVTGCRPDFSPDGKKITWGMTDWDLGIADIDFSSGEPKVTNTRRLVHCEKTHEVYHTDFSPDGKYIAFSYGPKAEEMVGGKAPGWNICITDLTGKWVQVTTDGHHNKEPDWALLKK